MDKKKIASFVGVATVFASAIALIDYGNRKAKNKTASLAELTLGIIGAAVGITLTAIAERNPLKTTEKEVLNLFDESDVDRMVQNISEVLGNSAETKKLEKPMRTIEIDEEDSIEDFIFNH